MKRLETNTLILTRKKGELKINHFSWSHWKSEVTGLIAALNTGEMEGVIPRFTANLLAAEAQNQKCPGRASVGKNVLNPY